MREVRKKWQQLSWHDRVWFCATGNFQLCRVWCSLDEQWSPCGAFLPHWI